MLFFGTRVFSLSKSANTNFSYSVSPLLQKFHGRWLADEKGVASHAKYNVGKGPFLTCGGAPSVLSKYLGFPNGK